MKCDDIAHKLGLDWECQTPEECKSETSPASDPAGISSDGGLLFTSDVSSGVDGGDSSGDVGDHFDTDSEEEEVEPRTYKDDSALIDQQSTGRKRAAKAYPMDPTMLCEWSMKKNCGGGTNPIVGCLAGLQQARHHGPDKNTLNNEQGNVHRICHCCHNRWHTLNDEGYVWGNLYDPHSPLEATVIDIEMNEEWWAGRKLVKAKD